MIAPLLLAIPTVSPVLATEPVPHDADDPAVWVDRLSPSRSQILGTDKQEKVGGLYVFDLNGHIIQRIKGLDRPNNVDVLGNLAVVTERKKERLRIFQIDPKTRRWSDMTGETRVFEGEKEDDSAPMGVALYRRPSDGTVFAIVTPKAGPRTQHVAQYRLVLNPRSGHYDVVLDRRFGRYSGVKETESVAVDHAKGVVYYSDERFGTRWAWADPLDRRPEPTEVFNQKDTRGDHEGIAIWPTKNWVVCTDQIPGSSIFRAFDRDSHRFVGAFQGGSDETDGLEICDRPLGPKFPKGILIAMNSKDRNFLVYDLRDVAAVLRRK